MTIIREGAHVSYIGYGQSGLAIGDEGKVLSNAGSASHVRWLTGVVQEQVLLVSNEDLVPAAKAASLGVEDDLESGPLVTLAVRDIYDEEGEVGLTAALADDGHLTAFAQIAEETLEWVQAKISEDLSVHDALSHLDPSEQTDTLTYMAMALLRDAFGREDS